MSVNNFLSSNQRHKLRKKNKTMVPDVTRAPVRGQDNTRLETIPRIIWLFDVHCNNVGSLYSFFFLIRDS